MEAVRSSQTSVCFHETKTLYPRRLSVIFILAAVSHPALAIQLCNTASDYRIFFVKSEIFLLSVSGMVQKGDSVPLIPFDFYFGVASTGSSDMHTVLVTEFFSIFKAQLFC
jgi:hypothetical protein